MIDIIGILLIVPSTLIITLAVSLVIYARWHRGELEALGIPVVKPHWLLGSNWNYTSINHHWEDLRRAEELGPIYGIYNGRRPEIFINDVDLLHQIIFNDSDHFEDKMPHDFGHQTINEVCEFINGDKWKTVRSKLSPVLTSSKLKMLSLPLHRISNEYISVLNDDVKKSGGRMKIDISKFLPPFALEVLGESLCGIKLKDARSPDNDFVNKMRVALWEDLQFDWTYNLTLVFPFVKNFMSGFPTDLYSYFDATMKAILDEREKSGVKIPDTVNALLEMREKLETKEYKRMKMNIHTIYGQAFLFLVAAFFGVNSTISYLFYHLATNPDVKKKVREEVDSVLQESKGIVDYDTLGKLPYLEACIMETFRKSTSFHRTDRRCTKDWEFKGYKIKKGMNVFIPMYPVHHNPQVHPEPEKFKPERFMPENKDNLHPCSFLQFGLGHRSCLGNKFMMETLKAFMVRVIRDFDVEKRADTVWKENVGNHYFLQMDPIYVDLVARK